MERTDNKNQTMKLTFIDIYPPINELAKNKEEINIIFQGHDNFYDFKKYLLSKTPIQLIRYKKSLMMTLLKSNNIMATGLLNVRQGEQNVIFTYEDKKKNTLKKAININNLLDSIKIKIFCEFDNINKERIVNRLNNSIIHLNNKDNRNNDNYIPKVNLMKPNHQKNKNINISRRVFEKKKKFLGFNNNNNSMKKNNIINSSQDFYLGAEYNTYLTEEQNNNYKLANNLNTNEIKKLYPYCASKNNLNIQRKNEFKTISKSKGKINKAKSKNNFSTRKTYSKQNNVSQMKLNYSSLNLINQNNKFSTIDTNFENNLNSISNYTKNNMKPTISFSKTNKRNGNCSNKVNTNINHKNIMTSLDNFISGQIIEHIDKSKKDFNSNNNSDKKNDINIYKSKNNLCSVNNIGYMGLNTISTNNNENIKRKFNNNNITMNSVSTAGTKKNELEFSLNSLQDLEDKFNMNKNSYLPFANRIPNEQLQQRVTEVNTLNRNNTIHKFNKSLCQQTSFTDKIFNENDLSNLNDNNTKNNNSVCKSSYKIKNYSHDFNNNNINSKEIDNEVKNIIINDEDIKKDLNEFNNDEEDADLEPDNFTKLKDDFNLLYNEEYIKQINEDLLKLEIELFIEKMSELFSAYHIQMDEKILENRIINEDYKKNIKNYLMYIKLNNKFQYVKAQKQSKIFNLQKKDVNLNKQNFANVNINMKELDVFKLIFPKENKSKELKKIISVILKKKENMELLGGKIKMLLK
jgi:hypothetical protein